MQAATGGNKPDAAKVVQSTEGMNKTMQSGAKDYNNFMDSFTKVQSSIKTLNQNPNDAYAQQTLVRTFAKDIGRGKLSADQVEAGIASFGADEWDKKIKSWQSGEKVVVQPWEIKNIINFYQNNADVQQARQLTQESQFKNSANKYGNAINWDAMRLPSKQYDALQAAGQQPSANSPKAPAEAIQEVTQNPSLLPDFQKKFGYNPLNSSAQQTQAAQQAQQQQQMQQQAQQRGMRPQGGGFNPQQMAPGQQNQQPGQQ